MSKFPVFDVPDFMDSDLQNVLPGADLLLDIERYRKVRATFLGDCQRQAYEAEIELPSQQRKLKDKSIETLFRDGRDPVEELEKLIAQIATIQARIEGACTGTAAKKLARRYEGLSLVHSELSDRVSVYHANLGTNQTVAMLLDE